LLFLVPLISFSQSGTEKIQAYLNNNYQKLGVSAQDVSDWIVESTGNSDAAGLDFFYVMQRYQGIDIFRAVSTFSIKNGSIFRLEIAL